MSQNVRFQWHNHMSVMNEFKNFLSLGIMVDVTLACDGKSLKAHKMVLSACSPFFKSLFLENPCKHPIVIMKDVKYTELKAILDYMYSGEVHVAENKISALIKTAKTLRVKGLGEVECQDDQAENLPDDEFENQVINLSENEPDDESMDQLVSHSDEHPLSKKQLLKDQSETLSRSQLLTDQNDDIKFTLEPTITEVPEIKQEVLDNNVDQNITYSSKSTLSQSMKSILVNHRNEQEITEIQNLEDSTINSKELTITASNVSLFYF